jgi:hypothetical protein
MSLKIEPLRESRTAPAAHGDGGWQEGPCGAPTLDGRGLAGRPVRGPWAEGPSAVTVTLPVAAPLETGKAAHVVVTLAEGAARGAGKGKPCRGVAALSSKWGRRRRG